MLVFTSPHLITSVCQSVSCSVLSLFVHVIEDDIGPDVGDSLHLRRVLFP